MNIEVSHEDQQLTEIEHGPLADNSRTAPLQSYSEGIAVSFAEWVSKEPGKVKGTWPADCGRNSER